MGKSERYSFHAEADWVLAAVVNWAIREIGQQSAELNAAAIVVAQHLQAPESRAARWGGSDALRELTSPKIAQRVARRTEMGLEW